MTDSVGEDAVRMIDWIPQACVCFDRIHLGSHPGSSVSTPPNLAVCLTLWKGLASQTALEKQGCGTCSEHAPELEPPLAPQ